MAVLISILGPNGKKAVYNETLGWVDTSAPGVTEMYVAISNALGFAVSARTVDENGWVMAQNFKFPGTKPPFPTIPASVPAVVDEKALAAALAPLLNESVGISAEDVAKIVAGVKQLTYASKAV